MKYDLNINIVPQVGELVKNFVIPNLKDFGEVYNTYICQNVIGGKVHFTNIILDNPNDITNFKLYHSDFRPERGVFYLHWEWHREPQNQYQSKTDEREGSNSRVSAQNPIVIFYIMYSPSFFSDLENTTGIIPDSFKSYIGQIVISTSDGQNGFGRGFSFEEEDIIEQSIKLFYYEAIALLEFQKQEIIRSFNKEMV